MSEGGESRGLLYSLTKRTRWVGGESYDCVGEAVFESTGKAGSSNEIRSARSSSAVDEEGSGFVRDTRCMHDVCRDVHGGAKFLFFIIFFLSPSAPPASQQDAEGEGRRRQTSIYQIRNGQPWEGGSDWDFGRSGMGAHLRFVAERSD